jgi:ribosomal protein S18 acetylase RimI-like enzyme
VSGVRVSLATAADDAGLRDLARREPVPGRITMAYEREPDFFLGCRVLDADPAVLVARAADGAVVGVACRSTRDVFVNGAATRLGYLGQLRVDRRFRGRWLVSRGFGLLAELHARAPVPAYLAAIVDGSDEATGVLVERPRRRFPAFRPVADCRTLAFATGAQLRGVIPGVRAARDADLPALAAYLAREGPRRQFSPCWSEAALGRLVTGFGLRVDDVQLAVEADGGILGVMAAWDQSAFKQSVVRGYGAALRLAAPFYNAGAAWLGRPRLPRAGEALRSAFAAFAAVTGDDPAIARALLAATLQRAAARGCDYLLLGADARDPLAAVFAGAAPHVTYRSRLYLAEWDTEGPCHARLDGRPCAVDIATF